MMPDRYNFREKPAEKRTNSGWITQVAIILLAAAAVLAWTSPSYWAQRFIPHSAVTKAHT
jgi:hypothetical protein